MMIIWYIAFPKIILSRFILYKLRDSPICPDIENEYKPSSSLPVANSLHPIAVQYHFQEKRNHLQWILNAISDKTVPCFALSGRRNCQTWTLFYLQTIILPDRLTSMVNNSFNCPILIITKYPAHCPVNPLTHSDPADRRELQHSICLNWNKFQMPWTETDHF